MRALITGGSGFVGANLARRLLGDGHDVHLVLRPGYRPWRLAGVIGHCRVHFGDLENAAIIASAVADVRPDWVFHLGVYGAYPQQQDPAWVASVNVLGTIHLAEACRRTPVGAFVHTGSSSEYGPKDHAPGEDESVNPVTVYGFAKATATQYCAFAARQHGLPARTLRLYSVYGPYEEPSRLIPTLLSDALRHTWPPLAQPDTAHDFIYVDDVVEACILAAQTPAQEPGAIYNIGTGKQTTLGDVVNLVRRMLDVDAEPTWGSMPNRPWDTAIWVADPAKAARVLGWSARISLAEGLRRTLGWIRASDPALYHEAR